MLPYGFSYGGPLRRLTDLQRQNQYGKTHVTTSVTDHVQVAGKYALEGYCSLFVLGVAAIVASA